MNLKMAAAMGYPEDNIPVGQGGEKRSRILGERMKDKSLYQRGDNLSLTHCQPQFQHRQRPISIDKQCFRGCILHCPIDESSPTVQCYQGFYRSPGT